MNKEALFFFHGITDVNVHIFCFGFKRGKRSLVGDLFGLLSAMSYGLFTGKILTFFLQYTHCRLIK